MPGKYLLSMQARDHPFEKFPVFKDLFVLIHPKIVVQCTIIFPIFLTQKPHHSN